MHRSVILSISTLLLSISAVHCADQTHRSLSLGNEIGSYIYPCGAEFFTANVPGKTDNTGFLRITVKSNGTYPGGSTSNSVWAFMRRQAKTVPLPADADKGMYCNPGSAGNCTIDQVCGYGSTRDVAIGVISDSSGSRSVGRGITVTAETVATGPALAVPVGTGTWTTMSSKSLRQRYDFWTVAAPSGYNPYVSTLNVTVLNHTAGSITVYATPGKVAGAASCAAASKSCGYGVKNCELIVNPCDSLTSGGHWSVVVDKGPGSDWVYLGYSIMAEVKTPTVEDITFPFQFPDVARSEVLEQGKAKYYKFTAANPSAGPNNATANVSSLVVDVSHVMRGYVDVVVTRLTAGATTCSGSKTLTCTSKAVTRRHASCRIIFEPCEFAAASSDYFVRVKAHDNKYEAPVSYTLQVYPEEHYAKYIKEDSGETGRVSIFGPRRYYTLRLHERGTKKDDDDNAQEYAHDSELSVTLFIRNIRDAGVVSLAAYPPSVPVGPGNCTDLVPRPKVPISDGSQVWDCTARSSSCEIRFPRCALEAGNWTFVVKGDQSLLSSIEIEYTILAKIIRPEVLTAGRVTDGFSYGGQPKHYAITVPTDKDFRTGPIFFRAKLTSASSASTIYVHRGELAGCGTCYNNTGKATLSGGSEAVVTLPPCYVSPGVTYYIAVVPPGVGASGSASGSSASGNVTAASSTVVGDKHTFALVVDIENARPGGKSIPDARVGEPIEGSLAMHPIGEASSQSVHELLLKDFDEEDTVEIEVLSTPRAQGYEGRAEIEVYFYQQRDILKPSKERLINGTWWDALCPKATCKVSRSHEPCVIRLPPCYANVTGAKKLDARWFVSVTGLNNDVDNEVLAIDYTLTVNKRGEDNIATEILRNEPITRTTETEADDNQKPHHKLGALLDHYLLRGVDDLSELKPVVVDIFTDTKGGSVELFINAGSADGPRGKRGPYAGGEGSCNSHIKGLSCVPNSYGRCSVVINPCDLRRYGRPRKEGEEEETDPKDVPAWWYAAVQVKRAASASSSIYEVPVTYTITWRQEAPTALTSGIPVSNLWLGEAELSTATTEDQHASHFAFTVPSSFKNPGSLISIQLMSHDPGADAEMYINADGKLAGCNDGCFSHWKYVKTTQASGSFHADQTVATITVEPCDLERVKGKTLHIAVRSTGKVPANAVGFVLTATLREADAIAIPTDTTATGIVDALDYKVYKVSRGGGSSVLSSVSLEVMNRDEKVWPVRVYVVPAFFPGVTPSSCLISECRNSTASSCTVYRDDDTSTAGNDIYIGVEGLYSDITFALKPAVRNIIPLSNGIARTETIKEVSDYRIFAFASSATVSAGAFLKITVRRSVTTGVGSLAFWVSRKERFAYGSSVAYHRQFSSCGAAGTTDLLCYVYIPACEYSAGTWYVETRATALGPISTTVARDVTFAITATEVQPTTLSTAGTAVSLTPDAEVGYGVAVATYTGSASVDTTLTARYTDPSASISSQSFGKWVKERVCGSGSSGNTQILPCCLDSGGVYLLEFEQRSGTAYRGKALTGVSVTAETATSLSNGVTSTVSTITRAGQYRQHKATVPAGKFGRYIEVTVTWTSGSGRFYANVGGPAGADGCLSLVGGSSATTRMIIDPCAVPEGINSFYFGVRASSNGAQYTIRYDIREKFATATDGVSIPSMAISSGGYGLVTFTVPSGAAPYSYIERTVSSGAGVIRVSTGNKAAGSSCSATSSMSTAFTSSTVYSACSFPTRGSQINFLIYNPSSGSTTFVAKWTVTSVAGVALGAGSGANGVKEVTNSVTGFNTDRYQALTISSFAQPGDSYLYMNLTGNAGDSVSGYPVSSSGGIDCSKTVSCSLSSAGWCAKETSSCATPGGRWVFVVRRAIVAGARSIGLSAQMVPVTSFSSTITAQLAPSNFYTAVKLSSPAPSVGKDQFIEARFGFSPKTRLTTATVYAYPVRTSDWFGSDRLCLPSFSSSSPIAACTASATSSDPGSTIPEACVLRLSPSADQASADGSLTWYFFVITNSIPDYGAAYNLAVTTRSTFSTPAVVVNDGHSTMSRFTTQYLLNNQFDHYTVQASDPATSGWGAFMEAKVRLGSIPCGNPEIYVAGGDAAAGPECMIKSTSCSTVSFPSGSSSATNKTCSMIIPTNAFSGVASRQIAVRGDAAISSSASKGWAGSEAGYELEVTVVPPTFKPIHVNNIENAWDSKHQDKLNRTQYVFTILEERRLTSSLSVNIELETEVDSLSIELKHGEPVDATGATAADYKSSKCFSCKKREITIPACQLKPGNYFLLVNTASTGSLAKRGKILVLEPTEDIAELHTDGEPIWFGLPQTSGTSVRPSFRFNYSSSASAVAAAGGDPGLLHFIAETSETSSGIAYINYGAPASEECHMDSCTFGHKSPCVFTASREMTAGLNGAIGSAKSKTFSHTTCFRSDIGPRGEYWFVTFKPTGKSSDPLPVKISATTKPGLVNDLWYDSRVCGSTDAYTTWAHYRIPADRQIAGQATAIEIKNKDTSTTAYAYVSTEKLRAPCAEIAETVAPSTTKTISTGGTLTPTGKDLWLSIYTPGKPSGEFELYISQGSLGVRELDLHETITVFAFSGIPLYFHAKVTGGGATDGTRKIARFTISDPSSGTISAWAAIGRLPVSNDEDKAAECAAKSGSCGKAIPVNGCGETFTSEDLYVMVSFKGSGSGTFTISVDWIDVKIGSSSIDDGGSMPVVSRGVYHVGQLQSSKFTSGKDITIRPQLVAADGDSTSYPVTFIASIGSPIYSDTKACGPLTSVKSCTVSGPGSSGCSISLSGIDLGSDSSSIYLIGIPSSGSGGASCGRAIDAKVSITESGDAAINANEDVAVVPKSGASSWHATVKGSSVALTPGSFAIVEVYDVKRNHTGANAYFGASQCTHSSKGSPYTISLRTARPKLYSGSVPAAFGTTTSVKAHHRTVPVGATSTIATCDMESPACVFVSEQCELAGSYQADPAVTSVPLDAWPLEVTVSWSTSGKYTMRSFGIRVHVGDASVGPTGFVNARGTGSDAGDGVSSAASVAGRVQGVYYKSTNATSISVYAQASGTPSDYTVVRYPPACHIDSATGFSGSTAKTVAPYAPLHADAGEVPIATDLTYASVVEGEAVVAVIRPRIAATSKTNVTSSTGRDNCAKSSKIPDDSFCEEIVDYTSFRTYMTGAAWQTFAKVDAQAGRARGLYDVLKRGFSCPAAFGGTSATCATCRGSVTPACDEALRKYACYDSYRSCSKKDDHDGFALPLCRDSACQMVVKACGSSFTDAGMQHLDCNATRYSDSKDRCTPFDDDGDDLIWLWILLAIIGAGIIIAIVAVLSKGKGKGGAAASGGGAGSASSAAASGGGAAAGGAAAGGAAAGGAAAAAGSSAASPPPLKKIDDPMDKKSAPETPKPSEPPAESTPSKTDAPKADPPKADPPKAADPPMANNTAPKGKAKTAVPTPPSKAK